MSCILSIFIWKLIEITDSLPPPKRTEDCPICLQPLKEPMIMLSCRHALHRPCYQALRDHGYRHCCMCPPRMGR